ncbi:MAG TPA: AAA family ATPase, partial [Ilumatobacteraceae bacterium]
MAEQQMVGRDDELSAALAARRAGVAGVVVAGPPGIGRTAMANAVADGLTDAGCDVVVLRVTASSQHVPFGALAPLLPADGDRAVTGAAVRDTLRERGANGDLAIV